MNKLISSAFLFLGSLIPLTSKAQVYTERQTRHRFALLTIGIDIESSFNGSSQYLNTQGSLQQFDFDGITRPRFMIGGTHFWGHADIYIAIPLTYPTYEIENQSVTFLRGLETAFKYYPWRIEN